MATLEEVMNLDATAFFQYIKTIRYGYQDQFGKLHFTDDEDFTVQDYAFSSPADIVQNNCGWCWDLAELIKDYCVKHNFPCRSWFMEYLSDDLHQTHTQVFLFFQGKWCPAPDNCLGLNLGTPCFDELEPCVNWFTNWFTDYLQSVLKEKFDKTKLLIKEYTRTFSSGITDEEYLGEIRENSNMKLNAVHHIAIIVSDIQSARDFYVNKLGFEIVRENYRDQRSDWKLDLKIGDGADAIELEIFAEPNPPKRVTRPEACGLRHLAFRVEDVEATVAELNKVGIECEPIRYDEYTHKKMTFFFDPDGLPLELHE